MDACSEIRELLGRYVDDELDEADARRVDEHVDACDVCAGQLRLMEREAEWIGAALAPGEVPVGLGAGLWARLRRRRSRWINVGLSAAAAAAVLLVAFLIGLVAPPGVGPAGQVARVDGCSGPLEVQSPGGSWRLLDVDTVLRRGDRLRNRMPVPGWMTLAGDGRFALGGHSEVVFTDGADAAPSGIELLRGLLHADLPTAQESFRVATPVAHVVAIPGPDGSEFELELTGVEREVGWLGRIHVLPAAYAGPTEPRLLLRVYRGRARVDGAGGTTVISAGEEVMFGEGAPSPTPFDHGAVVRWWRPGGSDTAKRPDPLPLPDGAAVPEPEELPRERDPGPEPPDDRELEPTPPSSEQTEPDKRTAPTRTEAPRPPAPKDVKAARDMTAVALSWKPVPWKRRIVEYHVYRSGADGREFVLHDRVPPPDEAGRRVAYRDERVSIGGRYRYQVAATARDEAGAPIVGEGSKVLTASPLDFRIVYTGGGSESVANIIVETLYKGRAVRKSFFVHKLDPVENESGQIGRRARVRIEPIPGTHQTIWVDFTTGYRLLDIMTTREKDERGIPHKVRRVLIEDSAGRRRILPATSGG